MRTRADGFTLLEIMVALAVAAVALTAIIQSVYRQTDEVARLRERTLVLYIASNTLTELRLSGEFPDVGRNEDDVEFAGRDWRVARIVSESGVEGLRRVDVAVSYPDSEDTPIRTISGFVAQRASVPAGSLPGFSQLEVGSGTTPGADGAQR